MYNHKKDYRFFPPTQDEIWYQHDEEVAGALYGICYGYADNSAWWAEKPDFVNTPPRYWDFEGPAFRRNHYEAQSPKIILELRRRVLNRLG